MQIVSPYSTQYTGGGDDAIIDGIRGTVNFASGEWQGYQGKTFEAVIDLQKETAIGSVGGSFLQVTRSWIWMPDRIEFEGSQDGVNFLPVDRDPSRLSRQNLDPITKKFRSLARTMRSTEHFSRPIGPHKARYVRVRAHNFGKIPAWHPGAGGDPWIFVDEIFIK